MNVPKLRIHPRGKMEASHLWACALFRLLHTRKGTFWKAISLSKEKHEWKRMSSGKRRSIVVPANTFSAQWYTTFRNCKCGRRSINLLVTVVVNEQSLFWVFLAEAAGGLKTKEAAHAGLENRQGAGGRSKDKMVLSKYLHILGVTTTTTPTSVWRQSGCPAIMRTPRVSVTSINLRAIRALESSLRSSFHARSNRGSSMKLSVRAKILQWYITLMYYVVFPGTIKSDRIEKKKLTMRVGFKSIWSVIFWFFAEIW